MSKNKKNYIETFQGYIETTADALLVFEGCRSNVLTRVQRRLLEKERQQITSGSIFVYDENESSIKRWTDGRLWSPSRILGNFLIYRELEQKILKKNSANSAIANSTDQLFFGPNVHSSDPINGFNNLNPSSKDTIAVNEQLGMQLEGKIVNNNQTIPLLPGSGYLDLSIHSLLFGPSGISNDETMTNSSLMTNGMINESNMMMEIMSFQSPEDELSSLASSPQEQLFPHQSQYQQQIDQEQQQQQLFADLEGKTVCFGSKGTYVFKDKGLIKKTMSITINGVQQHLVSYFTKEDVHFGRLMPVRQHPLLRNLKISPSLMVHENFRKPPNGESVKRLRDSSSNGTIHRAKTASTSMIASPATASESIMSPYSEDHLGTFMFEDNDINITDTTIQDPVFSENNLPTLIQNQLPLTFPYMSNSFMNCAANFNFLDTNNSLFLFSNLLTGDMNMQANSIDPNAFGVPSTTVTTKGSIISPVSPEMLCFQQPLALNDIWNRLNNESESITTTTTSLPILNNHFSILNNNFDLNINNLNNNTNNNIKNCIGSTGMYDTNLNGSLDCDFSLNDLENQTFSSSATTLATTNYLQDNSQIDLGQINDMVSKFNNADYLHFRERTQDTMFSSELADGMTAEGLSEFGFPMDVSMESQIEKDNLLSKQTSIEQFHEHDPSHPYPPPPFSSELHKTPDQNSTLYDSIMDPALNLELLLLTEPQPILPLQMEYVLHSMREQWLQTSDTRIKCIPLTMFPEDYTDYSAYMNTSHEMSIFDSVDKSVDGSHCPNKANTSKPRSQSFFSASPSSLNTNATGQTVTINVEDNNYNLLMNELSSAPIKQNGNETDPFKS